MFRVAIITVSDSSYAGTREDQSGPCIAALVSAEGYTVVNTCVVPDDMAQIQAALTQGCDCADLVLTTGGTGFGPRDVTPEATTIICEKMVPGIPEAMRTFSMQVTPRAMLTRSVAGIFRRSLIVNLPGSPKAVEECLTYILPSLSHGLEVLIGTATDCART